MILHAVLEKHDQLSDQFEKQIVVEQRSYASFNAIVLNLDVNYLLVLHYLDQSHIEINNQILHAFLFNIRNYSLEVINIQLREVELNIILPRVNNFDIEEKKTSNVYFIYMSPTPNKIWEDKG